MDTHKNYKTHLYCLLFTLLLAFPVGSKASVTWGTASAFQAHDTIILQWQTLTESNNLNFWVEVPQLGLLVPLGPYADTVQNSNSPTDFEIRLAVPQAFLNTTYCAQIYPDNGSGINFGNGSPWACVFMNGPNSAVWPGDANSDGYANVTDLLNIGIANGLTGPIRSNASTNWTAQTATDFTGAFANGINHKFSDCDGNGVIDLNDTTAIHLNYGLSHNKTSEITTNGVPLWLVFPDSVNSLDTVEVEIWLGSVTSPVVDAYGLSFTMMYDSTQVQPGLKHSTIDNSWLGTPGLDLVKMDHDDNTSLFDFAVVRTNGQNASGYGKIGSIVIVLVDNLGKTTFDAKLFLRGIHPILLDNTGQNVPIQIGVALGAPEQIASNPTTFFELFPNPANSKLTVQIAENGGPKIDRIMLMDVLGKQYPVPNLRFGKKREIDVSHLAPGTYFLRVYHSTGIETKKVLIQH